MLFTHNTSTIFFNQINGVEVKTKVISVLGMGGASDVIVYGVGNQKLEAHLVQNKSARKFESIVNGILANKNNTIPQQSQNGDSDLDEIERLSEMKDKGIITQEEFDSKKKQLLGL